MKIESNCEYPAIDEDKAVDFIERARTAIREQGGERIHEGDQQETLRETLKRALGPVFVASEQADRQSID